MASGRKITNPTPLYHPARITVPKEAGFGIATIRGSFPSSYWTKDLRLAYSISKHELFLETYMRDGDLFEVKLRGKPCALPQYPRLYARSPQDGTYGEVNRYWRGGKKRVQVGTAVKGKSEEHCEDAYFTAGEWMGIADGVAAWENRGVDAGMFARELMGRCQSLLLSLDGERATDEEEAEDIDMEKVVEEALTRTKSFGSCTVLLIHINGRRLNILNLGDSQAAVVRLVEGSPRLVFKTKPQTHTWNTPFQLANIPPHLKHSFIEDSVRDSVRYSVDVEPGDWVVMGTDGVWDNLFDHEIAKIIGEGSHSSHTEIAETITRRAYEKSISTEATPFGEAYCGDKEGWIFLGGKPDDITVVVAQVSE